MSKVNVYLADGFEEVEGLTVVDLLRRAGIETDMVSIMGRKEITGARKIPVLADKLFEEQDDPDVIVLPGGMPGTKNLEHCEELMKQVDAFVKDGKLVCAICAAPSILGHRGHLQGRKATVYPGMEGELTGAEWVADKAVTDGNIITARGMGCAIAFGLAIIEKLKGEQAADEMAQKVVYQL